MLVCINSNLKKNDKLHHSSDTESIADQRLVCLLPIITHRANKFTATTQNGDSDGLALRLEGPQCLGSGQLSPAVGT